MALSQESEELYDYWLKPSWVTPYAPYSLIGFYMLYRVQCSPEAPAAGVFAGYSLPKRRLLLLHKTTENCTCFDLDSFRGGKKGATTITYRK